MFEDGADDKVNAKALDMYALGVIMWQLWFKEVPYANKGIHQLINHVMKGNRPPLTEADKGFNRLYPNPPIALEKLIKECWDQKPNKRPKAGTVLSVFKSKVKRAVEEMSQDIGTVVVKPRKTLSNAGAADFSSLLGTNGVNSTLSLSPTQRVAIGDFLKSCGLEKYLAKLKEQGFTDIGSICDSDILDDDTLINVIGMSKNEVKTLRNRMATDSAGNLTINKKKSFKERKDEGKKQRDKLPSSSLHKKTSSEGPGTLI